MEYKEDEVSGLNRPKPQYRYPQAPSNHHALSLITLGLATIDAYPGLMVRPAVSLEISLSTPADKVASVSELRAVATVKNVGDEDFKAVYAVQSAQKINRVTDLSRAHFPPRRTDTLTSPRGSLI